MWSAVSTRAPHRTTGRCSCLLWSPHRNVVRICDFLPVKRTQPRRWMRLRKLVSSVLPARSLLPPQLLCVHEARALLGAHVPRNWYILQTRTSEELRPQPNSPQGTECHQQPCELGSRSIPSQASDETPALLVTLGWQPLRPWADPAELSPESWLQKQMCVVSSHCICGDFLRSNEQLIQIIKRHIHWEPNHLTLSTSILPVLCRQPFSAKGYSHRTCLIGFPKVFVPQKGSH